MKSVDKIIEKIFNYYENYGQNNYIGEDITQLEHMIQGAMLAEKEGCSKEIVIAVFLHDIGHLLVDENNQLMLNYGVKKHETLGRNMLESLGIPDPIPKLVENHVKAKRYLLFKNDNYNLSNASKESLKFQGGKMSEDEAREFESDELFEMSLLVRKFDERSKIKGVKINSLDYYRDYILTFLKQNK